MSFYHIQAPESSAAQAARRLSDFRPTAHFGMLCAVGLFAGQLFELLLMPALLGLRKNGPLAKPLTAPSA